MMGAHGKLEVANLENADAYHRRVGGNQREAFANGDETIAAGNEERAICRHTIGNA
jgi:hypothetical protein